MSFPPSSTTTITGILPAYLYQQYADDDNVRAFFSSYNKLAQEYLDWFVAIDLPVYTNPHIKELLLDWVAAGLYGMKRPVLPYGSIQAIGLINTFMANQIMVNQFYSTGSIEQFTTTDDVFKRILTWFIYKGDGPQLSIPWLKRRIMRFLTGTAGTAPNLDNTYPIGISFPAPGEAKITITLTTANGLQLELASIFDAAVQAGAISMPFQWAWSVEIVNNIGATNLIDSAGTLELVSATGWPTSDIGLFPGQLWSDSLVVTVVPGITPDPFAAPLFFGSITSDQLLIIGGGNLPLTDPGTGSNQLWNDGNIVKIA